MIIAWKSKVGNIKILRLYFTGNLYFFINFEANLIPNSNLYSKTKPKFYATQTLTKTLILSLIKQARNVSVITFCFFNFVLVFLT